MQKAETTDTDMTVSRYVYSKIFYVITVSVVAQSEERWAHRNLLLRSPRGHWIETSRRYISFSFCQPQVIGHLCVDGSCAWKTEIIVYWKREAVYSDLLNTARHEHDQAFVSRSGVFVMVEGVMEQTRSVCPWSAFQIFRCQIATHPLSHQPKGILWFAFLTRLRCFDQVSR